MIRPRLFVAVLGTAAVVGGLAACDEDNAPAPSGSGTLKFHQTPILNGSGAYVEGAISFIEVTRPGKHPQRVAQDYFPARGSTELAVGSYKLVSYERTCVGMCPKDFEHPADLDSPIDRCAVSIEIERNATTEVGVRVRPGDGCTIRS